MFPAPNVVGRGHGTSVHRGRKDHTMRARFAACAATCTLVAAATGVAASAATGPPPPKTFGGATATLYATGLQNPTSFAWGDGAMFAGDSGSSNKTPNGGVDIIANGTSTTVPNGPVF